MSTSATTLSPTLVKADTVNSIASSSIVKAIHSLKLSISVTPASSQFAVMSKLPSSSKSKRLHNACNLLGKLYQIKLLGFGKEPCAPLIRYNSS
jgi:hypothetical protein